MIKTLHFVWVRYIFRSRIRRLFRRRCRVSVTGDQLLPRSEWLYLISLVTDLASVGVGAGVGHGEHAGLTVLKLEVLVCELLTVDGLSTLAPKKYTRQDKKRGADNFPRGPPK